MKQNSKVAIVRCESYDYIEVKKAVRRGINLLGGASRFAKKGEKLLLKPNMLAGDPPEKCVTTHPSVFRAAGEIFLETGAIVSYGDSPAIGSSEGAAKKTGMADAAAILGIKLADFTTPVDVFYSEGRQNKKFSIAKGVLESDCIISLPKLKTHAFEKITGSVKNQFGCIPGFLKGEFHVKLPDPDDFARMLLDLNIFLSPRLYIMDGIFAMEGNGPRGGTPKKMNVLLFSDDPIALDSTVCRILDINPEFVPTVKIGYEFGAGNYSEEKIEISGDGIESFVDKKFNIGRKPLSPYVQGGVVSFLKNLLVPKPVIVKSNCIKCGVCINICPSNPKSVDWFEGKNSVPSYNYKTCIRCYCCQEICPEGAIKLSVSLARRFLNSIMFKKSEKNE